MAARRMATSPTTRRMTKATVTSAAPPVKGMEDAARLALRVPGTRMNLCVHRRARVIVSSGCGRKDRREGGRKEDEAFRPVKAARLAGDASIKKSSTNNGEPTDRSYRSQEVQTDPVEVYCALRYCEECVHSDAGIWTQGVCCSWFEKYTAVRRENRVLRTDLQHDRVEFGKVDRHLHRVQMSRFFKRPLTRHGTRWTLLPRAGGARYSSCSETGSLRGSRKVRRSGWARLSPRCIMILGLGSRISVRLPTSSLNPVPESLCWRFAYIEVRDVLVLNLP